MIGNATTARIRLALEGQGQVVRGLQEVQAGIGGMRSAMASIAGGLSLGAAVGQLVQVQREMDVLNASMVTVTGSSRAASTEMQWIKRFAAQTPYQLNEVTGAFVKMKALGLDASEKALRSYGNTASAMGKDLNQFIEAVADAATGEFERLKEFGIKAKKEGDSVSFNFQGVTTKLRNNAADITAYLQSIGNVQFAGATERRMQTLDGKISTLAKSWRDLAATVNEAGVGKIIETSVVAATNAITGLGDAIRENKTELAVLAGGLGGAALVATLPKVGAGLMIVAGGVKALGLALAANPLVLALLGIGAAAGAAAAFAKVQSGTVESMTRTVKELEALNARAAAEPWDAVLNANVQKRNQQIADLKKRMADLGQTARDAFALSDPRRTGDVTEDINRINPVTTADAAAAAASATARAGGAASKAADEFDRLKKELSGSVADAYAQAQAAAQGLNTAQTDFLRLANSPAWANLTDTQRQQVAALFETRIAQEQAAQSASDLAAANEQATRAYADSLKPFEDAAASAQSRVADMQAENQALALSESLNISLARAVEMTAIARLKEAQALELAKGAGMDDARVLAIQAEIDARQKLVDLMAGREVKEASKALREREAQEWARTWDQVGQSFTDALMEGGKSVSQYLKSLFRTLVLRPILAPIGTGLASLIMPGAASAGQGGGVLGGLGKLGSTISNLGNLLNGSSISAQLSGGFLRSADWLATSSNNTLASMGEWMQGNQWLGSGLGMLGNGFAGYGISKTLSGGYSTGLPVNEIAAIASMIPGVGPIAGVVGGLVNRAFGRKAPVTTSQGITGTFSADGANVQQYQDWFAKGGWFRSNKSGTNYSAVSSEMDSFLDDALAQVATTTRAYAELMSLNADALGSITQKVRINLQGMNAQQQEAAIAKALAGFGSRLAQDLLGTFETTVVKKRAFFGRTIETTVTKWVAGPFVRAGETAGEALARLGSALGLTNTLFDTLGTTLFAASLQGADYASSLVDAFGGLENLQNATLAYYGAYYSEQERLATGTRQMGAAMQALGLSLPSSRDGFRALVEAQDLTTEAGRSTYAALMGLAPAFAELTQTMEQLGSTVGNEVRRLRGLLTSDSSASLAALQAQFATGTAMSRAGDTDALARLPELSQAIEAAAALQAVTAADVALMRGQLAASLSETMAALGLKVPAFEVGTNYVPKTMLAQVHEGEAIVPRAYNPAAGGSAPGGDALARRVDDLVTELRGLRDEVRSGVTHSAKTARILDRVARDGNAFVTVAEA